MVTKICFRCELEKPTSEFYTHKAMADGFLGKCKTCTKVDSKQREAFIRSTEEGVLSERVRHREKYHRLGYKEKQVEWDKNKPWKKSSTYKDLRRNFSESIKRNGSEYNLPDEYELHHFDYNKLTDVIILTPSIHAQLHAKITFNLDTLTYNYVDIHVDTLEKHLMIIFNLFNLESCLSATKIGGKFIITKHLPFS